MKLSMKAEESNKERKKKTGHEKVRKHGRKDENTGAAEETYSIIKRTGTHIDLIQRDQKTTNRFSVFLSGVRKACLDSNDI